MPNVARLVEHGVMGNLATLQPIYSPMLWTSIATGKRPYKHGIHGFSEPDPDTGTVRPITNLSRKTKAVWNILHQQGKTSHVVGWWPSSPAEPIRGSMVSNHFQQAVAPLGKPWPMRQGTVHPPELAAELAELRIHPHELEGDMLRNFVPRAPEIDQEKDKRLATVAKIFAECSGIHAAATHLMMRRPDWDFVAVYYDAIDHFGHAFQKYHPPRLAWVSEEDFALYRDVVRNAYIYHDMMLGTLLELAGPDTTVILMSDHGFHPDHLRPRSLPNEPAGPAAEHRKFGIFVASGPGIRQDDIVFGASVLDIAPTILACFGLPTGRDMDGRVLTSIFSDPQPPVFIDSWDAVAGDDGRHPPETRLDPVDAREAIRQLVELGYIDEPDEDTGKAVEETTRELQYNLAMAWADGGRHAEARRIFSDLWERWPEESRFGVHLLEADLAERLVLEARETMTLLLRRKQETAASAGEKVEEMLEQFRKDFPAAKPDGTETETETEKEKEKDDDAAAGERGIDWENVPEKDRRRLRRLRGHAGINPRAFAFLEGSLLHLEGRHDEALRVLGQAAGAQTANLPSLFLKMGDVCLAKRDWEGAAQHFGKVLELDELTAQAHYGLAQAAYRRRDWEAAARSAATAAGQHFHYAPAHYLAGHALWKLGRTDEAEVALQRAIAINPVYPAAHRALATFCLKERADWSAHARHRLLAREARQRVTRQQALETPEELHPQEFRAQFGSGGSGGGGSGETFEEAPGAAPAPAPELPPLAETVVVVTGLPRSGTSMMMQMLLAGGIPVMADDHRPADASNERGYLEHDMARKLGKDAGWIDDAKGKAVKIVAQLLPHLPHQHRYRFVMMHRPLEEIVASQKKMLQRLGKDGAAISDEALMRTFQSQVARVRTMLMHLRRRGILDVLDVKYHEALRDPRGTAERIAAFLGEGSPFDPEAAQIAVAPELRHEGSARSIAT